MKLIPILFFRKSLFAGLFLWSVAAAGQEFRECQKLLRRVLPEFNRSFEENDPSVLKTTSYRRDVKALRKAYDAYHRNYYAPADSLAKLNNEAVLQALAGAFAREGGLPAIAGTGAPELKYTGALVRLLRDDHAGALRELEAGMEKENAPLNLLVARGRSEPPAQALAKTGSVMHSGSKWSYNVGVLEKKAGNREPALQHLGSAIRKKDQPVYRMQRGDLLMESGQYKMALQDYEKIAKSHPKGLIRYANSLVALERYEEAADLLEGYLGSNNRVLTAEACLILANAYYGAGHYEKARKYYEFALKHRPLTAAALCGLGNVALTAHRYATAGDIFDRLITCDSASIYAWLGKAVACFGLKNYEEAIRAFEKAGPLLDGQHKQLADVFVSRGYCFYHTGKNEQAKKDFETALKLDAERFEALAGLGALSIASRHYPAAGQYLRKALEIEKKDDRLWSNYGNLLLHFGMYSKAHEVFRNAVRLNPRNLNARSGWGVTLLEKDDIEKAKQLFDSLLRANPGHPVLLNNRGIVQAYRGNSYEQREQRNLANACYRAAEADFNKAMNRAPARRFYNVNKGNVFRYWHQFDDARLSYQSYQDKSALNNTAVMLAGQEKMKDAKYYMGVALQLDSAHRVFQYNMAVLASGKAREMARLVASAKDNGPYSDISIKYSLDGYVTIYLYDYEYDPFSFTGKHHLPIPPGTFSEEYLIPEYDFELLHYSEKEKRAVGKSKKEKPLRIRFRSRGRSGTHCPVLF